MTERELADECLAGNRTAHEKLWKLYSGRMYTVCKRYFERDEDAQDALQEGFIRIFQNLRQWQGDGPLGAWIRRVVVNTSLNLLKKNSRHGKSTQPDYLVELEAPDYDAIGRLSEEELINLIRQMPEGYRTVFNLYALEGFAHLEIADMLGVSENTSKTQYHKAKGWLKNRLEKPRTSQSDHG
jgi:RNA polymerase sigma-70 factor (ECF subfamily)